VADELERGELVGFRLDGVEPMRRAIHLLLPDDRDSTPSERAFIATLGDCCSVSVAGCRVDGSTNGR
jgi:DNA-binding transcriptional LysR family regulator